MDEIMVVYCQQTGNTEAGGTAVKHRNLKKLKEKAKLAEASCCICRRPEGDVCAGICVRMPCNGS